MKDKWNMTFSPFSDQPFYSLVEALTVEFDEEGTIKTNEVIAIDTEHTFHVEY